jgi:mono/diheme cytochrome c family protein
MRGMIGALSALLVGALVAGAAFAEDDPYVEAGENLYHQHCGSCHGTTGEGNGPVATLLDPKPANLTKLTQGNGGAFPEAKLLRVIDGRDPVVAHGTREMPIWGRRFSEGPPPGPGTGTMARGQVLLLLQYLKSIQR